MTLLPKWLRDKGISSTPELLMSMLPYMEWCTRKNLWEKYKKIIPNANKKTFDSATCKLIKSGFIESMKGGVPKAHENLNPYPYSYYRRIVRSYPRDKQTASRLDGTFGLQASKNRVKKKKVPKKSVEKLSQEDRRYIKDNPHGMSEPQLAEMFQLHLNQVRRIRSSPVR